MDVRIPFFNRVHMQWVCASECVWDVWGGVGVTWNSKQAGINVKTTSEIVREEVCRCLGVGVGEEGE